MLRLSSGGQVAGETFAALREVAWMPYDLPSRFPDVSPGQDVVVLVHGIFASAGVFRPMRRSLDRFGPVGFASFTHAPGLRVRDIAKGLSRLVAKIPRDARIHVVGHSLGGVVARYYVQEMGGDSRVAQTISLASPFGGAAAASAFPFLVGADLRETSPLLERLREGAKTSTVRHTSIIGGDDWLVFPRENASLGVGEVIVREGVGHNAVLFDHEVARIIAAKVRTFDRPSSADGAPRSGVSIVGARDSSGEAIDDDGPYDGSPTSVRPAA